MPAPVRSLPPPLKKRRKTEESTTISHIKSLEDELSQAIKANASLNKLADLVDLVVDSSNLEAQEVSKGIYALYRIFTQVISTGKMSLREGSEAAKAVKAWLWERLQKYTDFLVLLLQNEEKLLRVRFTSLFNNKANAVSDIIPSNPLLTAETTVDCPIDGVITT